MFRSSLQPTWDLTIRHPSRPSILDGTRSPLQSMWDLTILPHPHFKAQRPCWHSFPSPINVGSHNPPPPLRGPTSLLALIPLSNRCGISQSTPPPFGAQRPRWHTVWCFDSDTICSSPSPPLADIILFKLSLPGFPSRF